MITATASSARRAGDCSARVPGALEQRGIPSLDGLRAVSILVVIAGHLSQMPGHESWPPLLGRIGGFGVRIFFAISGYLITTLLQRELEATGTVSLRRFYFRRTLRIFPAYGVFLAGVALACVAGWLVAPDTFRWWPLLTYTSNFAASGWWVTGHSWSLSAEEQFYLVWPPLLLAIGRRRGVYGALALLALSPVARVVLYLVTHSGNVAGMLDFDAMLAGAALALGGPALARSPLWHRVLRAPAGIVMLLLGAAAVTHVTMLGGIRWRWVFEITVVLPATAIAITVGIAWCIANSTTWLGRLLNARPVRWLGVLSYSLYLWQQVFVRPGASLGAPAALAAALGAAVLSYRFVERPVLSLRQRLERRFGRRASDGLAGPPLRAAA